MKLQGILKQYWGFDSFRPLQREIIESVLDGNDVVALMPTGGGKSICFQVPAMVKEGLCLVVSPLVALMKDQVQQLRRKNITAFAIYSGMSRREVTNVLQLAAESNCKFLYVSPERLETNLFKEFLPALQVNLIAVDEAHCISQWGYDFRPPYLRIAALRAELPGVPILALTASATRETVIDICDKLLFKSPVIFRQSFARNNLAFNAMQVDSKLTKVIDLLQQVQGSAIVYCRRRRQARELSNELKVRGIAADFYHAGLKQEERHQKQDDWMKNRIRVIVCTNAFGMGIDKADVRAVIHSDLPDCLENYYQEAGRAGRDGKKSLAVLLFTLSELEQLRQLPEVQYPTLENIRLVYQALMNYLQIPSGTENVYYDFDFSDFLKKFQLDVNLVVYALKVLEQEEFLSFNEQVYVPTSIVFTMNKSALYAFERDNPKLEPLVKALLRNCPGIFDQFVQVHEKTISGMLRKDVGELIKDLHALDRSGVIDYNPKKDGPQIYITRARVKAEDLYINQQHYAKRKELCAKRIDAMMEYAQSRNCRSQLIASYFGEPDTPACGICDNCLREHNLLLCGKDMPASSVNG